MKGEGHYRSKSDNSTVFRGRLNMKVGATIKLTREAADLTVEQLSRALSVSEQYMYTIERGDTACPLWALYRIAEELDCTLDDLCPVLDPPFRGVHVPETAKNQND